MKITEVTNNYVGTGTNASPPSYLAFNVGSGNDLVELTNTGSFAASLNGYTIERWYTSTTVAEVIYTMPSGVTLNPGQTLVLAYGAGTNDLVNKVFYAGTPGFDVRSSGDLLGYVIKSGGAVLDAVGVSGYSFPVASAVTAGDWSGSIPSMSGLAGSRLTGADNNTASTWTLSTASPINFGVINAGIPASANYTNVWSTVPASAFTATGLTANTGALSSTTTYTFTITDVATGCTLVPAADATVTVNLVIPAPVPNNSTQCGNGTPGASISSGAPVGEGTGVYNWYTAAAPGGTLIQSSSSFTLSSYPITTTTSFYVSETGTNGCESARATVVATVTQPDAVSATPSDANPCTNATITLTAANIAGSPVNTYTYAWSTTGGANAGLQASPNGASVTATPTAPGTYTYTVTATDGLCQTTATTVNVVVKAPPIINSATATPATVCAGATVTLTALTDVIASGTATVGTGVFVNTATGTGAGAYPAPFGNYYQGALNQILFTAADLTASGLRAGNITSIAFDVVTPATFTLNGFNIGIKTTALTALTSTMQTGFTTVLAPTNYTPSATAGYAANTIAITPYFWDGTSNIIVQTCFANTGFETNAVFNLSATSYVSTIVYRADLTTICSAPAATATFTYLGRPNMKFSGQVASAGAGTLTYTWEPGTLSGSSVSVTPATTTTYTVSAYDPATTCTKTQDVIVTVNPVPTAPTSDPGFEQCGTGVPTANVTSTSGLSSPIFKWYTAETDGTLLQSGPDNTYLSTISSTTTFWVSEASATCEGLRTSVTAVVNNPDAVSAQANGVPTSLSMCLGASIDLAAIQTGPNSNAYVFTWTATGGAASGITGSMTGQTLDDILPTAAGTYTYTVSASDEICFATSSVTVTVSNVPSGATANSSAASVCTGSTVNLTSSAISGISVPGTIFSEGFETFPPTGWTMINAGFGNDYIPASTLTPAHTPHSGTNALAYLYDSFEDANVWAISPSQTLTGGQTYTISFWYMTASIGGLYPENLKVTVGSANTVAAQTTTLYTGIGLINETYAQASVTFTPSTTGTYYFGINCFSDADQDVLFVDDFAVSGPVPEAATYSWTSSPAGFTSSLQNPTNVTVGATTTYTVTASNSGGCTTTANVTVTALVLPSQPTATPSTQCGTQAPTASVTSTTGLPTPIFKWYSAATAGTLLQNGGSTYTTAISSPTTFWVAETNGTCESIRTSVFADVTTPPGLAITPAGATTFCEGGSVSLTAAGSGYVNFSWTPTTGLTPSNTATVTAAPTTTTTYTVVADDGVPVTGCGNTATITITVNPKPVISTATATPSSVCSGGTVTLAATSVGVGSGVLPTSAGATTTQVGSPFRAGAAGAIKTQIVYTGAELTAAGFLAGDFTSIGYNFTSASGGTLPNFQIKMGNTSTTTLTSTFQAAPSLVVFDPQDVNPPTSTGIFTLTFNTPFAWDGTSSILVEFCHDAPLGGAGSGFVQASTTATATASQAASACNGTATAAQTGRPVAYIGGNINNADITSGYVWQWNPGALAGATVTVNPTSNTDYTVTATNGGTGCSTISALIPVTIVPVGGTPSASLPTICAGGTSVLSANATGGGSHSYLWSTTETTPTISVSPTSTTTYTVVITDACGASSAPLPVTVNVNPLPTVTISPAGPVSVCAPATQTLTANTAAATPSYQWTLNGVNISGATSSTYLVTSGTGSYSVKVTDANTCVSLPATAVSVTINPQPSAMTITPAGPITICAGETSTLTAAGGSIPTLGTVGTGTTQNLIESTTNMPPYGNYYTGNRHQMLILASELTGQGFVNGSQLSSLAFDVVSNTNALGYRGFTIKLGLSSVSALTSTFETSATTEVYTNANFSPTVGWSTHTFAAPFTWDGTSNLLVETYFSNCGATVASSCASTTCTGYGTGVTYTQNAVTNQSTTAFISHAFYYSDASGCNPQSQTTASSTATVRPNMRFAGTVPTTITWDNAGTLNTATGNVVIASPLTTTTYTATATSGAGCTNSASREITVNQCPSVVSLNLFLQGFYNSGSGTMPATWYDLGMGVDPTETDEITVNLWSPLSLANELPDYTATAMLHTDGTASVTFPSGIGGNSFYIAVKHRNSIETWSKLPVGMKPVVNYNFTTGLLQAFDDGVNPPMAVATDGKTTIYSGDVNQDGGIDATDFSLTFNDANTFEFGYVPTDITGDGGPDATDMAMIYNNQQLFLFYARPY